MCGIFWPGGMCDLSFPTRDQSHSPCILRQSLNHRNTKEALGRLLLSGVFPFLLFNVFQNFHASCILFIIK